ncbi:hypothetical protein ATPR_1908 [Acetobacter tropicalis NBRC 101654]|uniref:Uncharacterized protein n=1 Tax=Acetobacter tropicalis NBRC 101654 TaxID=749388 RepID=F7VEV9_9PROT|nr:hypothetical protein ATPR_1908 [Acetobacter tropicalis NBRC 101654]
MGFASSRFQTLLEIETIHKKGLLPETGRRPFLSIFYTLNDQGKFQPENVVRYCALSAA